MPKIAFANFCLFTVCVRSMPIFSSGIWRVMKSFFRRTLGMSLNFAVTSSRSMFSEPMMWSSESMWMDSSAMWRSEACFSSAAVRLSSMTWSTESPTIPSAAEK